MQENLLKHYLDHEGSKGDLSPEQRETVLNHVRTHIQANRRRWTHGQRLMSSMRMRWVATGLSRAWTTVGLLLIAATFAVLGIGLAVIVLSKDHNLVPAAQPDAAVTSTPVSTKASSMPAEQQATAKAPPIYEPNYPRYLDHIRETVGSVFVPTYVPEGYRLSGATVTTHLELRDAIEASLVYQNAQREMGDQAVGEFYIYQHPEGWDAVTHRPNSEEQTIDSLTVLRPWELRDRPAFDFQADGRWLHVSVFGESEENADISELVKIAKSVKRFGKADLVDWLAVSGVTRHGFENTALAELNDITRDKKNTVYVPSYLPEGLGLSSVRIYGETGDFALEFQLPLYLSDGIRLSHITLAIRSYPTQYRDQVDVGGSAGYVSWGTSSSDVTLVFQQDGRWFELSGSPSTDQSALDELIEIALSLESYAPADATVTPTGTVPTPLAPTPSPPGANDPLPTPIPIPKATLNYEGRHHEGWMGSYCWPTASVRVGERVSSAVTCVDSVGWQDFNDTSPVAIQRGDDFSINVSGSHSESDKLTVRVSVPEETALGVRPGESLFSSDSLKGLALDLSAGVYYVDLFYVSSIGDVSFAFKIELVDQDSTDTATSQTTSTDAPLLSENNPMSPFAAVAQAYDGLLNFETVFYRVDTTNIYGQDFVQHHQVDMVNRIDYSVFWSVVSLIGEFHGTESIKVDGMHYTRPLAGPLEVESGTWVSGSVGVRWKLFPDAERHPKEGVPWVPFGQLGVLAWGREGAEEYFDQVKLVGDSEIDGQPAIHYRASKSSAAVVENVPHPIVSYMDGKRLETVHRGVDDYMVTMDTVDLYVTPDGDRLIKAEWMHIEQGPPLPVDYRERDWCEGLGEFTRPEYRYRLTSEPKHHQMVVNNPIDSESHELAGVTCWNEGMTEGRVVWGRNLPEEIGEDFWVRWVNTFTAFNEPVVLPEDMPE